MDEGMPWGLTESPPWTSYPLSMRYTKKTTGIHFLCLCMAKLSAGYAPGFLNSKVNNTYCIPKEWDIIQPQKEWICDTW